MPINALNEDGTAVDWWFMYKVAGKAKTGQGGKVSGSEYLYFDSTSPSGAKFSLSPRRIDKDGALLNTLEQLYNEAVVNPDLGWFFYNDENPIDNTVNSDRGHTKGALAFDLQSDTAFWLIHSTPKFSAKGKYIYPITGMPNAQTLLCISLKNADTAKAIANQMFAAQQPNVYLASAVPISLTNAPNDPRVKLINNQVAVGNTPVQTTLPFYSQANLKFIAIAKNKHWGLDFYNDLVGPVLKQNLEVETWEHDPTPAGNDSDGIHKVLATADVNLQALGIDISWPEADDHAKLAISDHLESPHFVCVGDLNFTIAQRKRGGGTVAFQCEDLWKSLSEILQPVPVAATQSPVAEV